MTTPPALSANPAFTPEHWAKVRREMHKVKVERITFIDADYIEFVFEGGKAFQRAKAEVDKALFKQMHAHQEVFVQSIEEVVVTGLFIPEQGWLFQMTDEDLANYARRVAEAQHERTQQAMGELREYLAKAIENGLRNQGVSVTPDETAGDVMLDGYVNLQALAAYVISALDEAKSAGAR